MKVTPRVRSCSRWTVQRRGKSSGTPFCQCMPAELERLQRLLSKIELKLEESPGDAKLVASRKRARVRWTSVNAMVNAVCRRGGR